MKGFWIESAQEPPNARSKLKSAEELRLRDYVGPLNKCPRLLPRGGRRVSEAAVQFNASGESQVHIRAAGLCAITSSASRELAFAHARTSAPRTIGTLQRNCACFGSAL